MIAGTDSCFSYVTATSNSYCYGTGNCFCGGGTL